MNPKFPPDLTALDLNSGYLCYWSHWRPDPESPDAQMPGERKITLTYVPTAPYENCLCGSGKSYAECCQAKPYSHPICPDPGWRGPEDKCSLAAIQSATFRDVNGPAVRARLIDDERLHCTEDTPQRGFWTYWDSPALEAPSGILCFGDIELKRGRILLVTAMSDVRMKILLDLLHEAAGDLLPKPRIKHDPPTVIDKRTRKMRPLLSPPRSRQK